MAFDVNTLFYMTMYVEAILGLLLLLAWVQNLNTRAMAWWGGAHLLRSLSIALYGSHGAVPDALSIDLAGALLFTAYGLTWTGARVFDGRPPRLTWIVSGAAAWVLAMQFAWMSESAEIRHLLSAGIIAGFSWAAAYEFWRGRNESLVSRWPAIVLLFAHGALFLLRTPLSAYLPYAPEMTQLSSAWLTVLSPEALMFMIAIAFVLLAIGKERTELLHKNDAMLDPLTGLANRRAFMQEAAAIIRTQARRRRPLAVFLVDLDHFKAVNDRYGHATGDRVLKLFAEVCSDKLRGSDLVGRIGGEEFAVLLTEATRENAMVAAERIRSEYALSAQVVDGHPLASTVSVGVAILQDQTQDLSTLLKQADQALYRAKARGRNRVEFAVLEPAETATAAEVAPVARAPGRA